MRIVAALFLVGIIYFAFNYNAFGQTDTAKTIVKEETSIALPKRKPWYEVLTLRGYAQIRYNRLGESNEKLKCDQCDRSLGNGGGFYFRRARIVLSGNLHERVFIYIQIDLANNASTGSVVVLNFLQLRDLYGDIYLNKSKSLRARVGLSKVPYGFENMQSSQNRIALDRTDALNSAVYNERDMGAFLYWSSKVANERFKKILADGLKGSGDFGVVGFGVFNGQTASRNELNNSLHTVARVAYPFQLKNGQFIEVGIQAFTGVANVKEARTATVASADNILEQRIAGSIVVYPQPFGFQAEYNIGRAPTFTFAENNSYQITRKPLNGGYFQFMYLTKIKNHIFTPYYRYQYYSGSKKIEIDARNYKVSDHEFGVEWLPIKAFEITAAYMISHRKMQDSANPNYNEKGNTIRLQFNY